VPRRSHKHGPKFYTVKSGNTLSGIAQQTGVSQQTIIRLNSHLNPSALQTGQRLRLRR
jgi:LysM repeat protein